MKSENTLLAILVAALIGVGIGGYVAWRIQEGRLTALKLEVSEQLNEDLRLARAETLRLNDQLQKAQHDAAQREQNIRSLAADLGTAQQRLRDAASAFQRRLSDASAETCRVAASTITTLFGECQSRYGSLAERADRHASDVKTLSDGWPR